MTQPAVSYNPAGAHVHVLLVQHCANRTGSAISGRLVAEAFRSAGWDVSVVFGFEGPIIAEYAALGCRTCVVPHKSWLRGGDLFRSAKRIAVEWRNAKLFRRAMAQLRPDVVYVNSLVSLAAAVAASRARIPCVWHIRELFDDVGGEMRVPKFGGRALVRRLLGQLASRRIAISHAVAENVLGTTDEAQVDIVPNAVDDEFFELSDEPAACRSRFELPPCGPVIGVPGTLRPMKGHPFFLEAAARIIRDVPECVVAITGSGEPAYAAQLQGQVERLGLSRHVRFLGTVQDMRQFYRACDVVCVPSVAEPFGRTVIEAFAVGTPVVATSVGGMRETITDGITGFLVKYGDVAGFASKVVHLLHDPAAARRMAVRARSECQERYSRSIYGSRLNRIVTSLIGVSCC